MISILSLVLSLIFILLSVLHVYWFFGGQWGLKNVIPTKNKNEKFGPPPRVATLTVAIMLAMFGLIYLVKLDTINIPFPEWLLPYAYWIIPSIFILRAIGEFKYVGLFKKIKHTDFAKSDTKFFIPLCLGIGCIGMLVQII